MTPESSLLAPAWLVSAVSLLTLLGLYGIGWMLVPRSAFRGHKLLRLNFLLTCGLLVMIGVTATATFGRFSYLTLYALIPLAGVAVWHWRLRGTVNCEEQTPESWAWREVLWCVMIIAAVVAFLQHPYRILEGKNGILDVHSDLGFFVEMVLALPEARDANGWVIMLGEHATAGAGARDTWYHWGPMFLGIGVRALSGLTAYDSLLIVANMVMSVLLLTGAGAVAGCLWKTSTPRQLLAGSCAIIGVQLIRLPAIYGFLKALLDENTYHYMRLAVGHLFSYKFEGVIFVSMLAVWLRGGRVVAGVMLFLAGVSAPHAVAALCSAAGVLCAVGFLKKDRDMMRQGAVIIAVLVSAWVVMSLVFRTAAPRAEGFKMVELSLADLQHVLRWGTIDTVITLILGALSLPGILHLIRRGEGNARILGWLALCALVGANFSLQALHRVVDRFHIVYMAQALLVMPVGIWGALRMAAVSDGARWRAAGLALGAGSLLMGVHDMYLSGICHPTTVWKQEDVLRIKAALGGEPVGYLTRDDRPWWISKHGMLGGLLESRIVRLSPIDETKDPHSQFYGAYAPFRVLPIRDGEKPVDWSLRLAQKLGIRLVIETPEDRVPARLAAGARLITRSGPLALYELPERAAVQAALTLTTGR
jgi:hypothetical protein